MERTLSIIKPDATSRNITGKVNAMIEEAGLHIVAQKRILLTPEQAEEFYAEHKDKAFFTSMIEQMTSAPVVVQILEADKQRLLLVFRNTDSLVLYTDRNGIPAVAEEGTIRKTFALSIDKNTVHGSDSEESAKREIEFFFSHIEIVG